MGPATPLQRMPVRRLVRAAVALIATLVLTSTAPAHAADSGIARALERIEAGLWSNADLALIRTQPELAAQVPDPTDAGTVTQQAGTNIASERSGALTAATTCGEWVRVVYTKRSLTGSVIYAYGHYVQYCRNGSAVTRWESRYDYLAQSSSVVYWREPVVNKQAGVGTSSAWSHFQRHIEYCVVKYGCYANTYPWSKITVYGKGGYTYTGANA